MFKPVFEICMDRIREHCKVTTIGLARHLLFFQSFAVIMKG